MGANTMGAADNSKQPGWRVHLNPDRKFYSNWRLICLNAWITLFLITSTFNGFDSSVMNGLQSLDQWVEDFNHPTGSKLGVLNAIQSVGALCALFVAPYLSDGIGRRLSVLLSSSILFAAALLQTFSTSVGMFIGSRFLVGFGGAIATIAAPLMISEIAYPPHRATLTSLYTSLYNAGAIAAAWTTFGCAKLPSSWAWRLPSLIQGIPSVVQILLLWFAPESPRWLTCKGREAQALKTLAHYHADGNLQDPLVTYELGEIKAAISADQDTTIANVGWSSFIKLPGNRKRLRIIVALGFFSVMSGSGLIGFYLSEVFKTVGITDPMTQLLINGLLQVWNLIISIVASCLVDRLGRRLLFLSSCAGMLVSFTMLTACAAVFAERGDVNAARTVIASIFFFNGAYCFGFAPLLWSYAIEILPFSIRAKGLTIVALVLYTCLIFNQYVNPVALRALGWKYYIFTCVVLALEFVYFYFFIVETKGMTLEETGALFDDNHSAGSQSTNMSELEKLSPGSTNDDGPSGVAEENFVTAWFNLPGLEKEEVSLHVYKGRLIVSEENLSADDYEKGLADRKMRKGRFERTMNLPAGTQLCDIQATMENGLLTVTFPKRSPEQLPQRISIS